MLGSVLDSRPKPEHKDILDTRVKCANCRGSGRVPAFMCEPDNEEDVTNNCGYCKGLGFTGHAPGRCTKFPSEKDWREYADRLEYYITELEAPFILTDKVPTVPGLYLVYMPWSKSWKEVTCMNVDENAIERFSKSKVSRYRWGSAPLPQPQGKNDG